MENMGSKIEQKSDRVKKAYIKPVINAVQLVAEEAVLATCKTGQGGLSSRNLCRGEGDTTCRYSWRS